MADPGSIWQGYPVKPTFFQRLRLLFSPEYAANVLPITTASYANAMLAAAGGAYVDGSADGMAQKALVAEIVAAANAPGGGFATLMAIESRLAQLDENALVARRYWTIRDRFRRVASPQAVDAYNRWSPNELDQPVLADPAVNPVRNEEAAAGQVLARAVVEQSAALDALAKADETGRSAAQTAVDEARAKVDEATKVYGNKTIERIKAEAATTVKVMATQPRTGETATGETATGETATGETATGETATGETATGETATGETATGETATGETATGETATGETATGETATGETATGETATGETATGETATGETATGETATGETATGETATGETATGETATGETATGETATGGTNEDPLGTQTQPFTSPRLPQGGN